MALRQFNSSTFPSIRVPGVLHFGHGIVLAPAAIGHLGRQLEISVVWSEKSKKQCVADLQQIALSAASIHASLKFGSLPHDEMLRRLQELRQLIDDARCAAEADDPANDDPLTD